MKTLNYLKLLLFTLLIGSCATTSDFNKRKYTKGKFRIPHNLNKYRGEGMDDHVVMEESDRLSSFIEDSPQNISTSDEVTLNESLAIKEVLAPTLQQENAYVTTSIVEEETKAYESREKIEKPQFFIRDNDDSLRVELSQQEVNAALSAERKAKTGLLLTILGGVLLFGIITAALGFLLMLIGLGLSIVSLSSVYNTREGRRKAWTSIVLFIVFPILAAGFLLVLLVLLW